MEITNREIEEYCIEFTSTEIALLHELNRSTHLHILNPRMLSGHLQGRGLSMISHMIRPKRILEIGTFTGYSALCLAEGLTDDGILYTIDVNDELEDFVNDFFQRSSFCKQIRFLMGDALEIVPTLTEEFDLAFIDADKKSNQRYYELILPKVRTGGFIVVDNVLWDGKVIGDRGSLDKKTKMIHEFNEFITKDERVENVLLPIRDGLMVMRKL